MMHWNIRAILTITGWSLLAACNPGKGQQTTDGASDGASASGTTVTGGSSGEAATTIGSSTSTGASVTTSGTEASSTDDTDDSASGGSGTSGGNLTTSTTAATAATGDETTTGTGTTSAESTTGGSMLIECNGCTCDPAVSYCQVAWSPTMDPPPEHPSGECPFITAGSYNYGCVAYPPECGEDPSCDCVP